MRQVFLSWIFTPWLDSPLPGVALIKWDWRAIFSELSSWGDLELFFLPRHFLLVLENVTCACPQLGLLPTLRYIRVVAEKTKPGIFLFSILIKKCIFQDLSKLPFPLSPMSIENRQRRHMEKSGLLEWFRKLALFLFLFFLSNPFLFPISLPLFSHSSYCSIGQSSEEGGEACFSSS